MKDKYVVAVAGIVTVGTLCALNLIYEGPDSTVTTAIVSAITFIVGLAFGYVKK